MAKENDNELETELETELGEAGEGQAAQASDEGDNGGVSASESAAEGSSSEADGDDTEPKSLAEALSAGIDALAKKGEKQADSAAGDDKAAKEGTDKDKPKEQNAADGKQPDGKDKPKDGEKQPDHVNDPIDARLAPRTQERIRSLADEVKTLRTVAENNGAMVGAIMDSGATPDEFGALVQYMYWTHSEKPEDLEAAYKLLQSELQGVALRLGKPVPEVDWLAGHQDLIDGVRNGLTTRETAVELAMHRASSKRTAEQKAAQTKKATQTKTEQEQAVADATTAQTELDALGDELAAADPNYKTKFAILVPKLREEFKTLPPKQWKGRFLEMYAKTVVKSPVAAVTPPKQNAPKNQPLRPSAPSGGQQKAPGSALDALSSAIDGMRG